jgi:hypothetical protein
MAPLGASTPGWGPKGDPDGVVCWGGSQLDPLKTERVKGGIPLIHTLDMTLYLTPSSHPIWDPPETSPMV